MRMLVHYVLGGSTGASSHNNPQWVSEVNRLIPLLDFPPARAGMSKVKRHGKKVVRETDGDFPYKAVATFPDGLRRFYGQAEAYYTNRILPWPLEISDATKARLQRLGCNLQLDVTADVPLDPVLDAVTWDEEVLV